MSHRSGGKKEGSNWGGSDDRRGGSGVHVYVERGAEVNLVREEDSGEGDDITGIDEAAGERETGTRTRVMVQPQTPSLKVRGAQNECVLYSHVHTCTCMYYSPAELTP